MEVLKLKNESKESIIKSLEEMLVAAKEGEIETFLWVVREKDRKWNWGMNGVVDRFETAGQLTALVGCVLHEELWSRD